jgi:hypothetical protein
LLGSVALALVVLVLWSSFSLYDRSEVTQIDDVPGEIAKRFELAEPEISDDNGPPSFVQAASPKGVVLNIVRNSWVQIKNADGQIIVSDVLKAGDQYFVPDNPGMTMSLGNAGGVEILLDGRALSPLGNDGDIRRDIPLDTTYLKTLEFKTVVVEEKAPSVPVSAVQPAAGPVASSPSSSAVPVDAFVSESEPDSVPVPVSTPPAISQDQE